MENVFLTFIKPYLSVIDNGTFFRKPFSWLYVFFAIISLLAPIYLIYNALNLEFAYNNRESYLQKFEVVSQQFEGVKQTYETAVQIRNQSQSEAQSALQNYRQAT
jgi:predicted ferric reductase